MAWFFLGLAVSVVGFCVCCWKGQEKRHKRDLAAIEEALKSSHATIDFIAREHNRVVNENNDLRGRLEWIYDNAAVLTGETEDDDYRWN